MIPYYTLQTINIGPLTFNTWGMFAGLAFAAALVLAIKEAKRNPEYSGSDETIWDLALLILAGGIIGARSAFVLENWEYFSKNQSEILNLREGGLMFYGGAIGAIILAIIYFKYKKIDGWSALDALAPSFAAGEFIGRIGCVLINDHIGTITSLPWAQSYIDGSFRHPVAIYMSLNGLAMLVAFWFLRTKIKTKGALFLYFVLWYSGIRFLLDYFRCDDLNICDPRYGGYTPSQYLSLGIFIISLIILTIRYRAGKKHMADEQKRQGANQKGGTSEDKNFQSSEETVTIAKEAIIKSGNAQSIADEAKNNKNIKNIKEKLASFIKKPAAMIVGAIVVAVAVATGVTSYYYESMFKKPIFSFHSQTWVSYDAPIVGLKIVNDKNCEKCQANDIAKQIKSAVIPTLNFQEIDFDSPEGKKFIEDFKIKSLPALIFDKNIEKAEVFERIKTIMENKDNLYYLNSAAAGIPQGKYLELPAITSGDRVMGPETAKVAIIEFSDFKCPYCKQENEVVKQVLAAYPNDVKLVYKHLPLPIHPDAQFAAEAAECAGDQGKFFQMADMLFDKQDNLDKDSIIKYARDLKLDEEKFKECADSGKFKSKIENDAKAAQEFGISGAPAFFVGDEFLGGALPFEQFKEIIDAKLKSK